jgi:putative membrane protein
MGMAHMGWGGGLAVTLLLFLVAAVLTGLALARAGHPQGHDEDGDKALELLRRRLATGEIDDEDYLRRRSALDAR